MLVQRLLTLLSLHPVLRKLIGLLIGIALLLIIVALIERNDRIILEHQFRHNLVRNPVLASPSTFTMDEQRIARQFLADTLPQLMRKGLITKYKRTDTNTSLFVIGHVWKERSLFVKQSLLKAVATYNKVNGFSLWTLILDNRNGKLYAQVLPSNRSEVYE